MSFFEDGMSYAEETAYIIDRADAEVNVPTQGYWKFFHNRLAFTGNRILRDALDDIKNAIQADQNNGLEKTTQVIPLAILEPVASFRHQPGLDVWHISGMVDNGAFPNTRGGWIHGPAAIPHANQVPERGYRSISPGDALCSPTGEWWVAAPVGWIRIDQPE